MNDGGSIVPGMSRDPQGNITSHAGLSIRDWFAGQALSGLVGGTKHIEGVAVMANANDISGEEVFAQLAYKLADAMLKAREERQ